MSSDAMHAALRAAGEAIRAPKPQIAPFGHAPRIGRASGGLVPDDPANPYTGPLVSDVPGRTDKIPTHVPEGSYVIPADIVSSLGEGNTLTGLKILSHMFSASPRGSGAQNPYQASSGPYGSQMPSGGGRTGPSSGIPSAPSLRGVGSPQQRADGGASGEKGGGAIPVIVAGGEFIVSPEDVKQIGKGDISAGHKILDHFVKLKRQEAIKTLKKLPGPAKK